MTCCSALLTMLSARLSELVSLGNRQYCLIVPEGFFIHRTGRSLNPCKLSQLTAFQGDVPKDCWHFMGSFLFFFFFKLNLAVLQLYFFIMQQERLSLIFFFLTVSILKPWGLLPSLSITLLMLFYSLLNYFSCGGLGLFLPSMFVLILAYWCLCLSGLVSI